MAYNTSPVRLKNLCDGLDALVEDDGVTIFYGALFAGTRVERHILDEMERIIKQLVGSEYNFKCVYVSEADKDVREFLELNHDCDLMVEFTRDLLTGAKVRDVRTNEWKVVKESKKISLRICLHITL